MEHERNKTAPVETDFYTEALKAFDDPLSKPREETSAAEPAAEVTEPVLQEKPKRKFNLWWAVALCALLCLALVIGIGRNAEDTSRGENYVYGILLEATDEYMILSHHQMFWYVELDGLENPYTRFGVDTYLWVFYDGEAEKTDLRGCDRKITATYWKADENEGAWEDKIEFDLDGDGEAENWSLVRTVWTDHAISVPTTNITLTAKDDQENILHNVHFYLPSSTDSVVFQNSDDGLSLVISRLATYEVLQIRIEDGELAVYLDGEAQKLYPHTNEPGLTITGPLMTNPEVPTLGPGETHALLFWLESGAMTGKLELSAGDARVLQTQLDALKWVDPGDTSYKINWSFQFYEGQEFKTYKFAKGVLLCDGKKAEIGTELTEKLMGLMGREMPPEQAYCAYISNGEFIQIIFYDSGMARVQVSDSNGNVSRSYIGRYSSIGDLYLMDLGEEQRHIMVLKRNAYGMEYMTSGSSQTMFRENEGLEFRIASAGGTLALSLRDSGGAWIISSEDAVIPVKSVYQLRQKLYNCDWQADVAYTDDEILGYFTVYDGVGAGRENPERYYLLTGGRLLPQTPPGGKDMIATMDKTLWQLLASFFSQQGESADAIYTGRNQDGMEMTLQLMTGGDYQVRTQLKYDNGDTHMVSISGLYVRMGSCLVLFTWDNGPCNVYLNIQDDQLVYDAARSKADMAFSQTTEVTLSDLQVDAYRVAGVSFDLYDDAADGNFSYRDEHVELSDEMAITISQLLSTLQWKQLQAAPSGIAMGSFSFADAASIHGSFEVYSGMRLVYGDTYEAKLTESQWATVCTLMTSTGDAENASQYARVGDVTYSLLLNERHQFLLGIGSQDYNEHFLGACSVLQNKVIVCFGYNGEMLALRMEETGGWCLLPGYNGIETFEIPDGAVFEAPVVDILPEESTPAT